ncbi:MAG: sugar ABC transporter permease, partial [Anaerolineae bacterium]
TTFDGYFFGRGAAIGILLLVSVAVLVVPYIAHVLRTEAEL